MQRLIDVKGEGLESMLNKVVVLFCANYFYTGILEGVNKTFVKLKDPSIIYETGDFGKPNWQTIEKLHTNELYVRVALIEAYAKGK